MVKVLRAKSRQKGEPCGEPLTDHLENTLLAASAIRRRIGRVPNTPPAFWTWVELAALLHDTGKLSTGFQRMINNTDENATPWGERHETLSLGFVDLLLDHLPADDVMWVAALVAAHHRPFTGTSGARKAPLFHLYEGDGPADFLAKFAPADQDRLTELMEWLHTTSRRYDLPTEPSAPRPDIETLTRSAYQLFERLHDRWSLDASGAAEGRTAVLLLGALTMADHLSSGHRSLDIQHPLTPGYPAQLERRLATEGAELRPQQRYAAEARGHLLLRSWTGSGKTEAALLWSVAQMTDLAAASGGTPRVFYLLPYLTSINATADRLTEEFGTEEGIGVLHSKAASYHLAHALADECASHEGADDEERVDAATKAHARALATKDFRELFRVGTPYQLLRGALAGATHSGILTDSANSVFILDELHAYDARRLGMILAMMRFWSELGGRIAVMSATLPTALQEFVYDVLGRNNVTLVEPPPTAHAPRRHILHTRQRHLTDPASVEEIAERLTEGRSVLVVANNVRHAIALYEALAPICESLHGKHSAFLLHSRFRRSHRNGIEKAIHDRFGTGKLRRAGLLVGTQALEVSLDLDMDLCHTSAADLEALLQRIGRVNRLGHRQPAPVIFHHPDYATRPGSGDTVWADGVYAAEPTQLAWSLLTGHEGDAIDERAITQWLDTVYRSRWGDTWRSDVEHHLNHFTQHFLTFRYPFDDRSQLTESFDAQFEGVEAILETDRDDYADALALADGAPGRLLASDYLIPMPYWGTKLPRWDKRLRVRVVDGEYHPAHGLISVRRDHSSAYRLGELV
ncbi:CRISPR-associated helicase Cas3' [Streptomyces sp. PT12]|uniref:CRISPR-associated helicase Cas3' n=1 Tax=Streptomyces sp. PT12 TaxID=1510197 RepID=UPI0015EE5F39|nr:CRISPR-associated helicase Cas3' [Streptomyces sp. PT12]